MACGTNTSQCGRTIVCTTALAALLACGSGLPPGSRLATPPAAVLTAQIIPIDEYCGDGYCDDIAGETCNTCPIDCGSCSPPPSTCNGTAGMWSGCRGNGCAVCQEKLAGYDCYFKNHPSCAVNTTCAGLFYTCNSACPQPTDADRCCTPDTCTTCGTPAPDDDGDGIPDQLERDLAYRFFPDIHMSNLVPDLQQFYPYNWKYIPFTASPLTRPGTLCEEPFNCIELRYGIAYDCGDYKPFEDRGYCDISTSFFNQAHRGDSEFYAAVVMRNAPWAQAQADASRWSMIRDFTAAHWLSSVDASRYGARGYCPSGCSTLSQQVCNSGYLCTFTPARCMGTPTGSTCTAPDPGTCAMVQGCSWIGGRCVRTGNPPDCLGWGYSECINIPGCQWLQQQCDPNIACDAATPSPAYATYYASEGKHGLYHSDHECDIAVYWQDNCGSNSFLARPYAVDRRLLQNVGESGNHGRFDTTIAEPARACEQNDVWGPKLFGSSTEYSRLFNYPFGWVLPPKPFCGDRRCDSTERCYDVPTGTGCADCGYCPYCGDGVCSGSETQASCPYDCTPSGGCEAGVCSDGSCCPPDGACPDGRFCRL